MHDPETMRRRLALAAICEEAANSIIDRIAGEGVSASESSLTPDFMRRYADAIRGAIPATLDAVREPDPAVQAAKLDAVAASIRAVSDSHHVPRLVERGMMVVGFRFAGEVVRRRAQGSGFTPDQLHDELKWLQEELEHRLS
jgi:hypothetical protein